MKSTFYRLENARVKKKNYKYFAVIGVMLLPFLVYSPAQNIFRIDDLFFHWYAWGAMILLGVLTEDLFYVKEMGKRHLRLEKYETVPVENIEFFRVYGFILLKYLLLWTSCCLLSLAVRAVHKNLSLDEFLRELANHAPGVFVLGVVVYFWFFLSNYIRNQK